MKPDEPDDMALGYLFSNRLMDFDGAVRVTHEEDFHQAQPGGERNLRYDRLRAMSFADGMWS